MRYNFKITIFFLFSLVYAGKPLSFKAFDINPSNQVYGRGDYLIVLASSSLESYLEDSELGGDFVKFKYSQGYNVEVISYDTMGFISETDLREYLFNYDQQTNGMLEYVLLVGDVNGQFDIPTFIINSYNEQELDVTDYPYTISADENYQEPLFFIGRWPIRSIAEFLTVKTKSIQYVKNENHDDLSFYNNALLVAGNYKTADGAEVDPSSWPVTPVWTSLWLYDELHAYEYANIDTAFFHQYNYQTATNNPLIKDKWDEGVGVINYRGWGDATGWHKPSFHLSEVTSLSNQWRLPVVMSFVCNTGDFGNDFTDPTGFNKCFGELLITEGSLNTPRGAAAMVGPSDLDTDTRFNNVICGVMWDGLLSGNVPELAPALHYGKNSLIDEFSGLEIENADHMTYDYFYHHVYGVLGDPSLPVILESPKIMFTSIDDSDNIDSYGYSFAIDPLDYSYIMVYIYDEDGNPIEDVVGSLFKDNAPFVDSNGSLYKGLSDTNGLLIIDFDLSNQATLNLYLNRPQYLQRDISIDYLGDENNSNPTENISIELSVEINNTLYAVANEDYNLSFIINNPSEYNIQNISVGGIELLSEGISGLDQVTFFTDILPSYFSLQAGDSFVYEKIIHIPSAIIGNIMKVDIHFNNDIYNLFTESMGLIVSNSSLEYLTSDPSPECNYGYQAYDNTDTEYDDAPEYNWIELNDTNGAENLGLQDDTIIKKELPFDFKYFGNTYNQGQLLTICSNGWIALEETNIDHFWNFSIPSPMGPSAMIAPFMDDLDDNEGTEPFKVWYFYDDDNNRLIIEWDDVSNGEDDQNCPNCIKESFQLILLDPLFYETSTGDGEIIFQYKEVYDIDSNGNYSTIGIESPEQNDGIQYLFNKDKGLGSYWPDEQNMAINGLAIKFTTGRAVNECNKGDLDFSGEIDIIDIIMLIDIVLEVTFSNIQLDCIADFNSDNNINIFDIISLVEAILNG